MTHSFAMWVGLIIHLSGSASPRKASHEWCPQDYSIPPLSLDSVYKYAQYSCSTHVGFKLKQKPGRSASPQQNSIGGPYHPPLWRCHSTEAQQACWLVAWLVGCLVAWLVRFFAVLVVVVWCVCVRSTEYQTNKRLTKQEPYRPPSWTCIGHQCHVPEKDTNAPPPAKRHMSGVHRITLYLP